MTNALVVIDVQQEYFTGRLPIVYPDRNQSLDRIVAAMRAATAAGVPVVVIEHAATGQDSAVFRLGTPEQQLHPAIEVEHRDHHIIKAYPGSFTGTDLGAWIEANGIDELVICGYMTHMCCDSTARQAAHFDLKAVVLADAMGTIDLASPDGSTIPARQVHETELAVLASRFARVTDTETWFTTLETSTASSGSA
jgi:nicotinamidase-related amidase